MPVVLPVPVLVWGFVRGAPPPPQKKERAWDCVADGRSSCTVAAAFTAFAIEGVGPARWGARFLSHVLPHAKKYIQKLKDHDKMQDCTEAFVQKFEKYLRFRGPLCVAALCLSESRAGHRDVRMSECQVQSHSHDLNAT